MPEKKSIPVNFVRDAANQMLLSTPREQEGERAGIAMLLEALLREAHSYHGYGEFELDNADGASHGLRRQYYSSPTQGVTLVRFVYDDQNPMRD